MSKKLLIPIAASLGILAAYSYYESLQRIADTQHPGFHYQIHRDNFKKAPDGSALIQVQHQLNSSWVQEQTDFDNDTYPFHFEIEMRSGRKFRDEVEEADF